MAEFKCTSCGGDVKEGVKFCNACGAPVERAEAPAVSKAAAVSFSGLGGAKKFVIPAIAAVIVLIAVFAAVNIFKPSKYSQAKGSVSIYTIGDEVVVVPNGKSPVTLDGTVAGQARSLDGTKAALLIDEGDDGFVLYYVTDKPQKIAEGVLKMSFSLSGNGLAFTQEADFSEGTSELCLYSGGKTTTISKQHFLDGEFSVSPDGKIVVYSNYDDGDIVGCYWNGKQTELGKDIMPKAAADGAKYIYYVKNDTLYVQKGTDSDTRTKLGDDASSLRFNSDLSQLIYTANSNSYISRGGGEKVKLSGYVYRILVPEGTAAVYNSNFQAFAVSAFADTFYVNDKDNIVLIDGKYETESIVRGVYESFLADDGKTITYQKNGSIYKVNGMSKSPEPEELTDDDVIAFAAADGGSVYYVNEDMELYYQKGKSKPVMVSDDFQFDEDALYYGYALNGLYNGSKLFYICDDELYASTGGKGVRVKGLEGDIVYVSAGKFGVSVRTDDGGDICYYRSSDGNNFTLLGISEY